MIRLAEKEPSRSSDVIDALIESCLSSKLGAAACCLLTVVSTWAEILDDTPVELDDSHLMSSVGVKSHAALVKLRKAVVDAGWLEYQPVRTGRGSYAVRIPNVGERCRQVIDAHHAFAGLASSRPWLVSIEARSRVADIRSVDDLHLAFAWVTQVCQHYLPWPGSRDAALHLCRLLDDVAEFRGVGR